MESVFRENQIDNRENGREGEREISKLTFEFFFRLKFNAFVENEPNKNTRFALTMNRKVGTKKAWITIHGTVWDWVLKSIGKRTFFYSDSGWQFHYAKETNLFVSAFFASLRGSYRTHLPTSMEANKICKLFQRSILKFLFSPWATSIFSESPCRESV